MVNFVVVDDNNIHRKKVYNIIFSYMMGNNIEFNIHEFDDYSKELLNYLSKSNKDSVYILDFELPNGTGIDIARKIRDVYNDWVSPIIILTAHTALYYEVYKQRLQILDFIGKCDNIKDNLIENIDICLRVLNQTVSYSFSYKNVEYNISYSDINYIQREERRTKIVTKNSTYYRNISISDIKKELPNYFIISSKGTIINTKNILKIDWNECKVYFKDNSSGYLVSKSHKKEFSNYEH